MLKPIKTAKGWKVVMFAVVVGIVLGGEAVVVAQSWREEVGGRWWLQQYRGVAVWRRGGGAMQNMGTEVVVAV